MKRMNSIDTVLKAIRVITALLLCLTAAAAAADKLYKWVDEDGNVTYQDTPPPEGPAETIVDPGAWAPPESAAPAVNVTFYSIETCDACDLVRKLLRERGVPFEEKDAEGDIEVQNELKQVAGELSVPVLQIGDEVFKGYNRELLVNELEEAGFAPGAGEGSETASTSGESGGGEPEPAPAEGQGLSEDGAGPGEEDDFATFGEEIFSEEDLDAGPGDDITQWEEIPEDERIPISQ